MSLAGHAVNVDNLGTNTFPQVGTMGTGGNPKFGGDNYGNTTAGNVLFNVTGTAVSWWDNPDQSKDARAEAATWSFKFISFVNGSGGTQPNCACAFDVAVTWAANAAPTTTWTKDNALSTSCTF